MKYEIKEILDKLKDSVDNPIDTEVDQFTEEAYDVPNYFCLDPTTNDCKILLDYITNLQKIEQDHQKLNGELREENKKLQEENERLRKQNTEYQDEIFARDNNWYDMQD